MRRVPSCVPRVPRPCGSSGAPRRPTGESSGSTVRGRAARRRSRARRGGRRARTDDLRALGAEDLARALPRRERDHRVDRVGRVDRERRDASAGGAGSSRRRSDSAWRLHLGRLAEELDEHRHLRAQHLGHDGRQDVVDRAAASSRARRASRRVNAVMKMIGVCAERWRSRISAAVSKPSMPGMLTSSRMTAKSCSRSWRSASRPERAVTMLDVERRRGSPRARAASRAVVDDQDASAGPSSRLGPPSHRVAQR